MEKIKHSMKSWEENVAYPQYNNKIITGDFSAKVGKESMFHQRKNA